MSNTAKAGTDRLINSAAVCEKVGGIRRETLSRGVAKGTYPQPDRIINSRNYWFLSTIDAWLAGDDA